MEGGRAGQPLSQWLCRSGDLSIEGNSDGGDTVGMITELPLHRGRCGACRCDHRQSEGLSRRGFEIFLSAHYGPETREDVQTKIDYLEGLKSIAGECTTADEFKQKVNERYPGYSGANYLDMTAGFFFPQ